MSSMSREAQAILGRYRAAQSLDASERARLLGALQVRIAESALVAPGPSEALRSGTRPTLAKLGAMAPKVIVALALAAAGGGAALWAARPHAPVDAATRPAPMHAEPTGAGVAGRSSAAQDLATGWVPAAPAPAPAPARPAAPPSVVTQPPRPPTVASASVDPVDEEVGLVGLAYTRLREGDPIGALAALEAHERRFPNGKLAESRGVTRVLALCQAGRVAQARAERDRFLSLYPRSPFSSRVRNACADTGLP